VFAECEAGGGGDREIFRDAFVGDLFCFRCFGPGSGGMEKRFAHAGCVHLAADHPIKANDPMLDKYYASLRTPKGPAKEYSGDFPLRAQSYRTGQHIGRFANTYLPWILGIGPGIVIAVIAYRTIVRRGL